MSTSTTTITTVTSTATTTGLARDSVGEPAAFSWHTYRSNPRRFAFAAAGVGVRLTTVLVLDGVWSSFASVARRQRRREQESWRVIAEELELVRAWLASGRSVIGLQAELERRGHVVSHRALQVYARCYRDAVRRAARTDESGAGADAGATSDPSDRELLATPS